MIFPKTKNARATSFGSVFCLPFRGGGKNRQLKLSIFAGGVSTAQVAIFSEHKKPLRFTHTVKRSVHSHQAHHYKTQKFRSSPSKV